VNLSASVDMVPAWPDRLPQCPWRRPPCGTPLSLPTSHCVLSSAMLLAASKTMVRCLTRSLQAASRGGRWAGAVSAERKLQLRLHMVLLAGMAVALLPGEATADSSEEGIA